MVVSFHWHMNRNEDLWGSDATQFRPERFLNYEDMDESYGMEPSETHPTLTIPPHLVVSYELSFNSVIRIKILTFYTHNPPYLDQNQDHSYFIIEHLLISKEDYLFLNISHRHQFGENTAPSHHKRLHICIYCDCLSVCLSELFNFVLLLSSCLAIKK